MTFDYTWLQSNIAEFLNRADLYATIPTFISLCETQIARRLDRAGVVGAMNRASTTISSEFELFPDDFAAPVSMTIYNPLNNRWEPLEPVTPSGMATIKYDRESTPGIPDRYCTVDGAFQFAPTPDQAYTIDFHYITKLPTLSPDRPTNWVLTSYPDAYLYGSLIHAMPYLRELSSSSYSSPLTTWQKMFDTACGEIIEAERDKRGTMFTPSFRATDAPPNYGRRRWLYNINTGY